LQNHTQSEVVADVQNLTLIFGGVAARGIKKIKIHCNITIAWKPANFAKRKVVAKVFIAKDYLSFELNRFFASN